MSVSSRTNGGEEEGTTSASSLNSVFFFSFPFGGLLGAMRGVPPGVSHASHTATRSERLDRSLCSGCFTFLLPSTLGNSL